jgi:sporulation protein YlmC with PRC-barrel domain
MLESPVRKRRYFMKRWLYALTVPVVCLVVSAGTVSAQQNDGKRTIHPAGKIMGMDVRNTKNESLGHIQDIVINLKDGRTVYVALGRGQVLGFGGSLFAIAPQALSLAPNGEYVVLNANNADFENAKGFDLNAWPNTPDRRWGGKNSVGADVTLAAAPDKGNENLARVSAINGLNVYGRDESNKEVVVGRIYDLAMNCDTHQVAYAAVHHGGTLGVGGKLIAMPWTAITLRAPALNPQQRAFFVDATVRDFESEPGFTSDNWPAQPTARFKDAKR